MLKDISTISPIDGSIVVQRRCATSSEIQAVLAKATFAQRKWRQLSLADRCQHVQNAVAELVTARAGIAEEITRQMGRPIRYTPSEINAFQDCALHLISIAPAALADVMPAPVSGMQRLMRREPHGIVFIIAPWNFPLLTCVNSLITALLAGNTVVLRHSSQTPLVSERLVEAFHDAGVPDGVLQYVHTTHADTRLIMKAPEIDYLCFIGNSSSALMVEQIELGRCIGLGLELSGVDPTYIRADADLEKTVDAVVEGAMFNSGQSCSGVQRVYVHASRYQEFLDRAVVEVEKYVLGNPLNASTTLGPLVRLSAATTVREIVGQSMSMGAKCLIDIHKFALDNINTPYMAPQILANADHQMKIMQEDCFGPVFGVMPVQTDEQAIELMNDSHYGLSASVFTQDITAAMQIGAQVQTGTWLMNRCDYHDPALAWSGVKQSGRGVSSSYLGFVQLTRVKSYHMRSW
ncbi:aldehyde dehydrogenase family protein [Solimicrobium silvestre]|uniref:NAD-dependent aldehyde dehydrogenase n=1 Tax=Solimicrobium silvestre TaxID=2099400 RepID=A0A2S9GZS9_9BURK|nr:aldehyde dehydrogenase family protein [Solimicrobium silvestre]PRC93126.1 NAD-dependent aldehyde dehydrogenase [Solimicrobium silvestre]